MRPPPSAASASEVKPGTFGSSCCVFMILLPYVLRSDLDAAHGPCGFRSLQIDQQEPVFQFSACDRDAVGEHPGAGELPRSDAAMQEYAPRAVVGLPAGDHQLVLFNGDLEFVSREAGDSERDPDPLRPVV